MRSRSRFFLYSSKAQTWKFGQGDIDGKMMQQRIMRKWILTVVSILLFACGGGSDSEISATTASAGQVLVQTSGGDFTAIPDIPFDYELQPGAATASGRLPAQIFAGEVLAFNGQPVSANTDI